MERIIKAIEEKLASQECTIYVQKHEIEELKRKLAEAEKTIEEKLVKAQANNLEQF